MSVTQASALTKIAPVIFALLIGGAGGWYLSNYRTANTQVPIPTGPPGGGGGGMMGGPGGGGMGGMMGGGGGGRGGGGGQASPASALPRLVRNLATIQKVQEKGVTAEQSGRLLPILQEIQSAEKLSEKECEAKIAAIEAVLTEPQKEALQALQPFGRGGGGGGMGGGMGRPGGGGGGMGGMMGGGGGGGGQDPERPFASERNKQALTDLTASLK